ncbi:hypothetical protein IA539_16905 [Gordonia sp. zg691]|uniref:hypothetical protein n=1 Tax=Gordonia jinghuaiqii TaxID=2758710 RepID=UPI001662417E|nr:hypothetical protein [Gordonia jinghuaiqii]MBD0862869.1 hypothetical protein [Gordonia jinghuaiqii]
MPDNDDPTWTSTDAALEEDPDMPADQHKPRTVFPGEDDTPIGETERIAEEKGAYDAAPAADHSDQGHALGGSEGTAEGQ